MRIVTIALSLACLALISGCASKKPSSDPNIRSLTSYAPINQPDKMAVNFPKTPTSSPLKRDYTAAHAGKSALQGRTLYVGNQNDLKLRPGEVILTFDDGPVPAKTEAILNSLDNFGVKATFLVVGNMVNYHPDEFAKVLARGHTIGSHTKDHAKLTTVSFNQARQKIREGEHIIKAKTGQDHVPFFRFPYLADTPALRDWLAQRDVTVLDVDIDSKDYFKESPQQIVDRTMARVKQRGSGIILFHDIHARSVAALPLFLKELQKGGYKVVTLKAKDNFILRERMLTVQNNS